MGTLDSWGLLRHVSRRMTACAQTDVTHDVLLRRYCLGAGLALVEMKVLLALIARQYSLTCDNNTEWVQSIGRVPKVRVTFHWVGSLLMGGQLRCCSAACCVVYRISNRRSILLHRSMFQMRIWSCKTVLKSEGVCGSLSAIRRRKRQLPCKRSCAEQEPARGRL